MKKQISNFLTYNWFNIILVFILSFSVFYLINYNLFKYKNYEKINFFIEASSYNEQYYVDVNDKILMDSSTEEVNFYVYYDNLSTYYEKFGVESDILILSTKQIQTLYDNDLLEENYYALDETFMQYFTFGNDYNMYYDKNGTPYGYYLYLKDDSEYNNKNYINKLFTFNEEYDYVILVNRNSVNFNILGEKHTTMNGFLALNTFLTLYKEKDYV